jgi:hypothetical protein
MVEDRMKTRLTGTIQRGCLMLGPIGLFDQVISHSIPLIIQFYPSPSGLSNGLTVIPMHNHTNDHC